MIPENDITVSQEVFTMGRPVSYDRAFAIEFVPAAEGETFSAGTVTYPVITAREGIDFELDSLFIPAGKISGNVKLTFHRQKEMQDTFVKVRFRLVANENFIPCAADSSATQKILTPDFIYYVSDGEPSCPPWWKANAKAAPGWDYDWGNFYPEKYRRMLQYFQATKESCPAFYEYAVTNYGKNLDNPDAPMKFWRKSYMAAWAKYVALPLYEYYEKWYAEHPEDPNYELMGSENVNINARKGWGNPMSGTYGFLN